VNAWSRGSARAIRRSIGRFVPVVAVIGLVASSAAGCGTAPGPTVPLVTIVPIGPSPWPNGTVGANGLRIDPTMLKRLPIAISSVSLVEDATSEETLMDDDSMGDVERAAAARYGTVGSENWLQVWVVHFKPDKQNGDGYGNWIDQYAAGACSQVTGTPEASQSEINGWTVDVTTCGSVTARSVSIGDGTYISMLGMGDKDLGKLLLEHLF
jgi:hypothetical protein